MADERRRSELEELEDALADGSVDGVSTLREVPFLAQVGLRVDPADVPGLGLPVEPSTVATTPLGDVLWLGPDEWLVVGEPGSERAIEAALREAIGEAFGTVVDLSANRVALELSGPAARDVLASCCPLDLHPRVFGPGRCAQTLLAKAGVILQQLDEEPTYRLLVRPSFARYVVDWLLDGVAGAAADR